MMTAQERAQQINAATTAWINEAPGRWSTYLVEEASHWEEYGITTGDQLDAYLAFQNYVDCYKDVHGIKPRWMNWEQKTAGEWEEELDKLYDIEKHNYEFQQEQDKEADAYEAAAMAGTELTHNPFGCLANLV